MPVVFPISTRNVRFMSMDLLMAPVIPRIQIERGGLVRAR